MTQASSPATGITESATVTSLAPDVGALVEYGRNGFNTGPGQYRVTAWMRVAPEPKFEPDDFIGKILFEGCQELRDARDGKKKRMQFCLREEATHLSLVGIGGTIAPVELCTVTGMVDWRPKHLEEARESARRLGSSHRMLF